MEPEETILISGRIIAEFEDDADPARGEGAQALKTNSVTPPINPALPSNDGVQPKQD